MTKEVDAVEETTERYNPEGVNEPWPPVKPGVNGNL